MAGPARSSQDHATIRYDQAAGERNQGRPLRQSDYRGLAAECLRLAETIRSPTDRAMLIRMAQIWHRMAEEKARTEPHPKP